MALRGRSKLSRRRNRYNDLIGKGLLSVAIIAAALLIRGGGSTDQVAPDDGPVVVAEYDSVMVPVPDEPVPAGTKVSEIHFREVSFPRHQIPQGAVVDLSGYGDAVAIAPLPAKLPVFEGNLSFTSGAMNPVIEQIPRGMRAMTVSVDETTSVEGWAGSGTIVDVLLIEDEKTSVIAEKVKVLSAERSVDPVEGSSAPTPPTTVTLLVTQDQCLKINTAIPRGKIAFALRSANDTDSWGSAVFTSDSFSRGNKKGNNNGINGYVKVQGEGESKSFALSDGKWIRTSIKPEGFRLHESE